MIPDSVAILGTDYDMKFGAGVFRDHLPRELERRIRRLTSSWGADDETCSAKRCRLPSGDVLSVFLMVGTWGRNIGVTIS